MLGGAEGQQPQRRRRLVIGGVALVVAVTVGLALIFTVGKGGRGDHGQAAKTESAQVGARGGGSRGWRCVALVCVRVCVSFCGTLMPLYGL